MSEQRFKFHTRFGTGIEEMTGRVVDVDGREWIRVILADGDEIDIAPNELRGAGVLGAIAALPIVARDVPASDEDEGSFILT